MFAVMPSTSSGMLTLKNEIACEAPQSSVVSGVAAPTEHSGLAFGL